MGCGLLSCFAILSIFFVNINLTNPTIELCDIDMMIVYAKSQIN